MSSLIAAYRTFIIIFLSCCFSFDIILYIIFFFLYYHVPEFRSKFILLLSFKMFLDFGQIRNELSSKKCRYQLRYSRNFFMIPFRNVERNRNTFEPYNIYSQHMFFRQHLKLSSFSFFFLYHYVRRRRFCIGGIIKL